MAAATVPKTDADSQAQAKRLKEEADESAKTRGAVNDPASLDEMDSDEDRVDALVERGWAPTSARRYYGLDDPNSGLAPDLDIPEPLPHLKANAASNTEVDKDPLRDKMHEDSK